MAHDTAHHHEDLHSEGSRHGDSLGTYLAVFVALMVLLIITLVVSFFHFGIWNWIIALTIALIKAFLVVWFFMHVRHTKHLTWVFAGVGFVFLGLLISGVLSDVFSRDWTDRSGREVTEMQSLPGPFEQLMLEPDTPSGPSELNVPPLTPDPPAAP
jgi:cytochrome c oxidase subunit 4